jgi:hypothetical protein
VPGRPSNQEQVRQQGQRASSPGQQSEVSQNAILTELTQMPPSQQSHPKRPNPTAPAASSTPNDASRTKRSHKVANTDTIQGTAGNTPELRAEQAEDGEDEDEDPFETDRRAPKLDRRAARDAEIAPPPSKRARPTIPVHDDRRATAPVEREAQDGNDGQPDLAAIEQANRDVSTIHLVSRRARGQPQQRTPWSHADTLVLLQLVGAYQCAWSVIANEGNRAFETPRDQQAVRDKSRNLKVDFIRYLG